uniref:Uncharacterized protein n=1 Tax=Chromera velia CCMP2878 TaxID=1169474 RepID=A0A0G4FX13_9ALVE|eukprot:Cvel_3863.t1-p1 / transcript=Cvel_3863.t1 / gene=Cvel_3863 / organism=Chromera_velia_CCMP2878 / gene_product=hypothetical protein / transcript_product=hypothetical protein / location=Cvel_scaffold163:82768-84653(+) / protein_length=413 / sequence_SO=supercontig / SO=protein_coding / is_pseudo=false
MELRKELPGVSHRRFCFELNTQHTVHNARIPVASRTESSFYRGHPPKSQTLKTQQTTKKKENENKNASVRGRLCFESPSPPAGPPLMHTEFLKQKTQPFAPPTDPSPLCSSLKPCPSLPTSKFRLQQSRNDEALWHLTTVWNTNESSWEWPKKLRKYGEAQQDRGRKEGEGEDEEGGEKGEGEGAQSPPVFNSALAEPKKKTEHPDGHKLFEGGTRLSGYESLFRHTVRPTCARTLDWSLGLRDWDKWGGLGGSISTLGKERSPIRGRREWNNTYQKSLGGFDKSRRQFTRGATGESSYAAATLSPVLSAPDLLVNQTPLVPSHIRDLPYMQPKPEEEEIERLRATGRTEAVAAAVFKKELGLEGDTTSQWTHLHTQARGRGWNRHDMRWYASLRSPPKKKAASPQRPWNPLF